MTGILKGSATPVAIVGQGATATPNGFEQITALSSAKHLTPPAGSQFAVISPSAQGVRWRDDGTAPTASVGMPVPVNGVFTYSGDLTAIQFIEQTASATLNVSYYK